MHGREFLVWGTGCCQAALTTKQTLYLDAAVQFLVEDLISLRCLVECGLVGDDNLRVQLTLADCCIWTDTHWSSRAVQTGLHTGDTGSYRLQLEAAAAQIQQWMSTHTGSTASRLEQQVTKCTWAQAAL